MALFYKPADGWAGDFIPFYWDGTYHLFYIKDYRDEVKRGRGMSWHQVTTGDFFSFRDLGEAIPHGGEGEQDLYVFTGSVMEDNGIFHIFYTGHNPSENWEPRQAIMHATSDDLVSWTKDTDFLIQSDGARYEMDDWRDPYVFWNPDAGEFWMLVAARTRLGPSSRRGCLALLSSDDLVRWDALDPFWAPGLYHTHECPDLFRWGDLWYLVYSTFTERFVTHYRMSESPSGPWRAPPNDTFDGRAFYAAKTSGDGRRRFSFGWNPTRKGETDSGEWQWGGSLVVHEILRHEDGSLGVRLPPEIGSTFTAIPGDQPNPKMGNWEREGNRLTAHSMDGFSWCEVGKIPETCKISTRIHAEEGTRGCGLILRCDEDLGGYYQVRLEPVNRRFVFDRWPRPGDQPFMLERPLVEGRGAGVDLEVIIDGSIMEIYASGRAAMSARAYDHKEGHLGLFISEGSAAFEGTEISVL